jgi:hypothetical protein
MRILLSRTIISFGLFSLLPVQAQQPKVSNTQVAAMVEALRQSAPQNSQKDGFYSDWQVKPETIKLWTKFCLKKELTPQQFESKEVAREVVSCIVRRELDKQFRTIPNNQTAVVNSVACWWMTGKYSGCNSAFTANYVKQVAKNYQKALNPTTNKQRPSKR